MVDLRSDTGPEVKDASGTNTINWEGNVVDTIYGGAGDEQITGNASANMIGGSGAADTLVHNCYHRRKTKEG
jgi:Ca2+-binding RTX toxin-like protein